MFFAEVSGTPYEMGYQFGRATRLAVASTIDFLTKSFRGWDDARLARERERYLKYTEKRLPELIEEIQGIADGSGFSFRLIYLANCYASLRAAAQGCTNIIFTRTPEGPLLAKTNDLPVSEGKHSGVCLRRPQVGLQTLSLTFPGTAWRGAGLNEAGLAIGGSSCSAQVPLPTEFLNPHMVGAYVLANCATVKEAIALLREVTCSNWGANLTLLDKSGAAAIVEKAGTLTGVRLPDGERLWCANHALTPELAGHSAGSPEAMRESRERFETIDRLTRDRPLSLALMRAVLAYSGRPGALSRYGDDDPVHYETELASIMRPAECRMDVCFSHPDRDPWRHFSLARGWEED